MSVLAARVAMCVLWLLAAGTAYAGSMSSNFVLIDSLSAEACKQVAAKHHSQSLVMLDLSAHSSQWLIRLQMQKALRLSGVELRDSLASVLHVGIADCSVKYIIMPNERDSLVRLARVELRATQSGVVSDPCIAEYRDVIARSDVSAAETPRHDFASSDVPAMVRSTWDDLLEPLIVLAALVPTVVLLFTVRSQ